MMNLKRVCDTPLPCKICQQPAPIYGNVDFNRSCEVPNGIKLPSLGIAVHYRRCSGCGFLFTDAFDDWSEADFKKHIYNDSYHAVDPDYKDVRPRANAALARDLFGADKAHRRVLDYGGGNDILCAELRSIGFPVAVTYDPFVTDHARPPEGTFDLITCFETLEHMPDPLAGIGTITTHLADPGLVLFSTLLQPDNINQLQLNWWYVGPRNGHVSLFSRDALAKAWSHYGCHAVSLNANVHIAFRSLPTFLKRPRN